MIKLFQNKELRAPIAFRALVLTSAFSVAALGCTTNPYRSAAQPGTTAAAGGSMTPSVSSTPGSAGPAIPTTMISAAFDAGVDAIAVLEANRGFQGRVLGLAMPGTGAPSFSMQHPTGQFFPPVNPQTTVNSSISSPPVPAIVSGAAEVIGGGGGVGFVSSVTLPGVGSAGTRVGPIGNFGVTGVSNTTATGLANVTTPGTNIATGTNVVMSTGVAAAPATAGSVLATPILATSPGLNVDHTAIAGGAATLGTPSGIRVVNSGGRVLVTNQGSQ